jgi:beta-galactosidase
MKYQKFLVPILALLLMSAASSRAQAPASDQGNRVKINFGATAWKFYRGDPINAQTVGFNDGSWTTVGIPHTWNENDIYVNTATGVGAVQGGPAWYRKHFTLDTKYSNRKIFVEFEASHIAAQVYINGTFIKGNSSVNPNATHVIGFLPFIVDLTPYVTFGTQENVLAVKISSGGGFYQDINICMDARFGHGCYGLWRPVWMHITDKVYIPANCYSTVSNWGTYVATESATDASASVRVMTNVQNQSGASASVSLTTQIVDASNVVVATQTSTQTIADSSHFAFDQTHTVTSPHLWYPAASPYGTPYMYKVYHIVKVGGVVVDAFKSPLGIRVITWDNNGMPVINGHVHEMWGVGSRYDYPALATAVPEEQQWRDAKIAADYAARLWRPGHCTGSPVFADACDAYGIMLAQPSGDNEGNLSTAQITDYKKTIKSDIHREMVVHFRNNPSILMWEISNGPIDPSLERNCHDTIDKTWEPVIRHPISDRGFGEAKNNGVAEVWSCSGRGCASGFHTSNPTVPIWGAEEWDYNTRYFRFDYANELTLANVFINNWLNYKNAKVFGFAHWYFSETPGETGLGRGFQEAMFDGNRIPKMLAKVYRACWMPYSVKPVVHLANHWNRSGAVTVNAFSNCPKVRLLINGQVQGTSQVPSSIAQCSWNVTWAAGTLRAEGLDANNNPVCADSLRTAGSPDHILLTVEPPLVKPDGNVFKITANGTDAAFILATVVDAQGIWCPTASNAITFAATPAELVNYRGGADHTQTAGQPATYHAPGDHELNAEGGMTKIAVRTTFQTGTVTVTATSPGLGQGTASYTVAPAVIEVPIFDTPVAARIGVPAQRAHLECHIVSEGRMIRFFVNQTMPLSAEILSANGRIVKKIPFDRCEAGWHTLPPAAQGAARGNGVYFVRLSSAGDNLAVKRVVLLGK